jgi:hypothetical protein
MKTTTKQKNFTMISDKLCRVPIKKISQTEKIYIAYILRYQANGNTLFASNKSIGEQLGIDGGSVKKINNKMNKQFNFFSAIQDKKYDNGTEYSSSHTIKVDEKLLDEFLDNVSTFIKEKPSTQNKAVETTIPIKDIVEDQVEEIVAKIEENEVPSSTKRIELIRAIKAGAKKYYTKRMNDEHYDKQIKDLCDFYNECDIKYLDELTEEMKTNIKLELKKTTENNKHREQPNITHQRPT